MMTDNNRIFNFYYAARQPIFNNAGEIWGYELLFRSGGDKQAADITNHDIATLCVATFGFAQSQDYCDETKKICINFTEKLIMEAAPRGLPPSVTVIELPGDIRPGQKISRVLNELKQEGFTLAIDNYTGSDDQKEMLDLVDIIKIDIQGKTTREIEKAFLGIQGRKILKTAIKVDSRETLQQLRSLGCDLYQGYFFSEPVNLRGRSLKSMEVSKMRIIQHIDSPELTLETLNEVIAADPGITYRLLRLLNSAAFSFPAKIESVRHAARLIGLNRLRYWLRMVVMSDLSGIKETPELYWLSLNRGRFLEELAQRGQIKISSPEAMFLFGMLSLIEPMLEIPIDKILDKLPLADEIKSGYIDSDSAHAKYLQLAVAVENADPDEIEKCCRETRIDEKEAASASNRAIAWTNTMLRSME